MENFLNNNEVFTVDLSSMSSPADVVFELTHILDDNKAFGKKISLKLGNIDLSRAQLLSLKSLIGSINSELYCIESPSEMTVASAQAIGIETPSNPPVQETFNEETVVNENILDDFSSHEEKEFNKNDLNDYEEAKLQDLQEDVTGEHYEKEDNVLAKIEQSVEFEELAQNSNVRSDVVQDALSGIYNAEKKLENILDSNSEQITFDLAEPLDISYTGEDKEIDNMSVKYVKQTVRSGNVITSEGNLVIIGDCHPGSEIHAAGDITVWGMLGGIAHAGNKGNKRAKVRALKLNPIQLRIANLYTRRPDALHTIYNEKTSVFTPEEARIINEEIVIYTMNEK